MTIINKMMENNKGSGYWFLYGIAFVFALAFIYLVFNQIVNNDLLTASTQMTPDASVPASATRWLGFWKFVPFMLVFVVLLFMFLRSTQRDLSYQ